MLSVPRGLIGILAGILFAAASCGPSNNPNLPQTTSPVASSIATENDILGVWSGYMEDHTSATTPRSPWSFELNPLGRVEGLGLSRYELSEGKLTLIDSRGTRIIFTLQGQDLVSEPNYDYGRIVVRLRERGTPSSVGDPLTKEKYSQLKTGMSREEVVALLGEPTETIDNPFDSSVGLRWKRSDDQGSPFIAVILSDGKATRINGENLP
jgi:hypothetical protein